MVLCPSRVGDLPGFSTARLSTRTHAWNHQLSVAELEEAAPLVAKIDKLLNNVTGVHIIATFVWMRVWLLRAHAHPMWVYEGPADSIRMTPVELSTNELAVRVRLITSTKASDPCHIECPVTPYGTERSLEEVSKFIDCICFFCSFCFLCFYELCFAASTMQGHSIVSSLPPLPEHGPTAETTT